MTNFFLKIFLFFQKRKYLLFSILLIIIGLCVFSITRISIEEDITNFLPNDESQKNIQEIYKNNTASNKIFIFINNVEENESSKSVELQDVVIELANYLQKNDSLCRIKKIISEIDQDKINEVSDFILQNIPLYLSDCDYLKIDSLLYAQNIDNQLNIDKQLLLSPAASFFKNIITSDPLFFSKSAFDKLQTLQTNDNFTNEDGFIFTKDGEAVIILTSNFESSETQNNALLAKDIQNACDSIVTHFDNKITIESWGPTLIAVTNASQIKSDSLWTGIVAIIIILIVLFYFFRNFREILLIGISIIFGFLFSLGIILFFKSSISIIVIGIATVIVGIAINYPIHIIAHYKHNPDKIKTIREIVSPLLIGNITTVAAFLCLIFVSSDSMKDLGLFASLLLVGTIIFVLIFLPHFLRKNDTVNTFKTTSIEKKQNRNFAFGKIASFSPEKNKWLVMTVVVLTIIFFVFSFGTSFEPDLHTINYMTQQQAERMKKMETQNADSETTQHTAQPTIFIVAEGNTEEEALQNNELIINEITVLSKSGIDDFILSKKRQQEKIDKWNEFWSSRKEKFIEDFKNSAKNQKFNNNAFNNFYAILEREYQPENIEYFTPILESFGENYITTKNGKTTIITLVKPLNEISQQDNNETNYIENQIDKLNNPNIFIFDNNTFFKQIVNSLQNDFNYILFVCGFIVFIFLLFSFGRIELSIIAFIPLTVAWIWILGLMNIFDIRFNIINIILATFIFGQGDDYTIFVTEGLIYEYTYRKKFLANFKNSILLSFIIMIVAIGMLIFAKHPAMKSLAEVTIVGMISVLLMAYIFPPLIFKWLTTKKGKFRLMPITLANLAKTIFSFLGFLFGVIIVTLAGFFILTIGGKTKKHKLLFHKFLHKVFVLISKLFIGVKITKINKSNENFDNPSVIICNHQSHLDLLFTLFLSPKIIALTNNWVWNNPFYGIIIRYADFIPITEDLEHNILKIKEKVEDGYSILIFPEGTRSEDCSILRFHKGAFEIAQMLDLDIVPVMIHGVGQFFPKSEFMLRKGNVHVEILERITPKNSLREGKTTLEITKNFRNLYKNEYARMQKDYENVDFYRDLVYKNYIYKGFEVQRAVKRSLKAFFAQDSVYAQQILEQSTRFQNYKNVLIKDCNYGEISLLLALVYKKCKFTTYNSDNEHIMIAENCISVPENLVYTNEILNENDFDFVVWFNSAKK